MSQEEDDIIQKLAEQQRVIEITVEDRDRAVLQILHHPDTPGQIANAWECVTKFYETTKAMGSSMQQQALEAAVFINKLRATYELIPDNRDTVRD